MTLLDGFSYRGKTVAVVGGATGIGQAVAELTKAAGADVTVLDRADVALEAMTTLRLDLADKASVEAAVDQLGPAVHALFLCAGVGDGAEAIERINFVGHRHLVNQMLDRGLLPSGSAIGFISSTAGLGWEASFMQLAELLDLTDFDEAARWMRDHDLATYVATKQAVCAYVSREALGLLKRGIRINALCPGPTDTPLAETEGWLATGVDYRAAAGLEPCSPVDQAMPLVFLCSDAATAITGITLTTDQGRMAAGNTGAFPAATMAASYLLGRPAAFQPGS
jgi:NAD(P)-dependent dehydrogenase (short-subunit alcohol dehydrogenase family)